MRNISNEFPTQTGAYAVKVKNSAGWRAHNMVRLQISVGQAYHEDDKLAATLEWVRHRFDHVIICINDTLQRFNYQFEDGLPHQGAFVKAQSCGDQWLERNRQLIDGLPSVEVHRWEDWKTWPDYALSMHRTETLFKNNREFREAIAGDVYNRWQRRMRNNGLSENYRFAEFSRISEQYLLEETAIFSLMYRQDKAVDVYPGSALLPCTIFQGRKIEGAPTGLELGAFTRIDFSRNKSFIPEFA